MPLILEFEGKQIFNKYKIPLLENKLVTSAEEAKETAVNMGFPVIIKAQVFSGGRGKRGLIKLAKTPEEVIQHSIDILSKESDNRPVTHLLVEKGANIENEYFISMVFDMASLDLLILFSVEGGVDIETLAEERPEAIDRINIPFGSDIYPFQFFSTLAKRGLTGSIKIKIASIIATLATMMQKEDLQLAEINPLVLTKEGEVIALDARVIVDDDAQFRHPDRKEFLSETTRYTPSEIDARENGLAYVDLGGDVGMLSVGAGLGMATADLIEVFGGTPRNFLDVGGGASEDKVESALRIMVKDTGLKSILINAFGGITRLDEIARGILIAIEKQNIQIPIIIRLMGTNYKEGIEILKEAGYEAYEEMEPAIEAAVKASKGGL
ncbi:MAG: Succinyl-CoA ligase [ADP-forming] subunit beta [Candidatus Heimdallarchaeota archaeon LC_2]|nr:MAG: Succinyl-CoA ligase [ADP-forming] subunit beta [Candidatus Heimdallarchaeota archaeon LC_2]